MPIHFVLDDPDGFARLLAGRTGAVHVLEDIHRQWRHRTGATDDQGQFQQGHAPRLHVRCRERNMEVRLSSGHPDHDQVEQGMVQDWWPDHRRRAAGVVRLEGGER